MASSDNNSQGENDQHSPITIDGGILEGGGQILRIALSLCGILGRPIHVWNIRGSRPKPGLMAQHMTGVRLTGDLTGGRLSGDQIGSKEIRVKPGAEIRQNGSGEFFADTRTAGSVTLLLQATLPILAYRARTPTSLRLRGGTNVSMAPQVDFTTLVLRPLLQQFGIDFSLEVIRRGFYPKGGGEILVTVQPNTTALPRPPVVLDDVGQITRIDGISFGNGRVGAEIADSARRILKREGTQIRGIPIDVQVRNFGPGSGVVLVATTSTGCRLSGTALGSRELSDPSMIGAQAAEELLQELTNQCAVDQYIQDQLIIFMALSSGRSSILAGPLTMHTKTAIYVTEQMLPLVKFTIQPVEGRPNLNLIQCDGISLCSH